MWFPSTLHNNWPLQHLDWLHKAVRRLREPVSHSSLKPAHSAAEGTPLQLKKLRITLNSISAMDSTCS